MAVSGPEIETYIMKETYNESQLQQLSVNNRMLNMYRALTRF